jgi:hypothetical protein
MSKIIQAEWQKKVTVESRPTWGRPTFFKLLGELRKKYNQK